jgi:hypothetical protein
MGVTPPGITRRGAGRLLAGAFALPASLAHRGGRAQPQPTDPPQTPILMPDTGMHVGAIRGIAIDRAGGTVVTGGTDKVLYVWEATTGQLLRRLFVPIGDGEAGTIEALCLTPDGRSVLAASIDYLDPTSPHGILYLIDVRTGALRFTRGQAGFNGTFHALALSPSGAHLAAAAQGAGLYALDMATGRPALPPRATPEAPVEAVTFAPDGRLVVATRNGQLRWHDLRRPAAPTGVGPRLPANHVPATLAFSPDGTRLAIGYANQLHVHVFDLRRPDTPPLRLTPPRGVAAGGNLSAVAWGHDGSGSAAWLFAAGRAHDRTEQTLLLAWSATGGVAVLPVGDDSVTQLVAHPLGGVLFASADPAWGWVGMPQHGRLAQHFIRRSTRPDFRAVAARLWRIGNDAGVVEFQAKASGSRNLRFSLLELTLETEPLPPRADMHRPNPAVAHMIRPGAALQLLPGERIHGADETHDGSAMVFGTDMHLLLADPVGRLLHRVAVASTVWAVAAARTRPIAVAALGDGTLRWYRVAYGRLNELGGLFIDDDGARPRWVAWTAAGRYAHSDLGGQDLVGYVQNGRRDAPHQLAGRWLGVAQVYRQLHDPGSVSRMLLDTTAPALGQSATQPTWVATSSIDTLRLPGVLLTEFCPLGGVSTRTLTRGILGLETDDGDAGHASTEPAASGPPGPCVAVDSTTETLELPQGTEALRVALTLSDGGGGVRAVDAFVNARNAGRTEIAPRRFQGGQNSAGIEVVVPLSVGENLVSFRAYNAEGNYFATPPRRLLVQPRSMGGRGGRTLRVLAVGINRYTDPGIAPLAFAVPDAEAILRRLGASVPSDYTGGIDAVPLLDGAATQKAIREALAGLAARTRPDDAVVIYLAGHGVSLANGGYAFVPADAAGDSEQQGRGGIGNDTLVHALGALRAGRSILMLDTCHAGGFEERGVANIANETGRIILAAAASLELALDSIDGRQGVFARALLDGLEGAAATDTGEVDALTLGVYVRTRVPTLARQRGHSQTPVLRASGAFSAFPLATRS